MSVSCVLLRCVGWVVGLVIPSLLAMCALSQGSSCGVLHWAKYFALHGIVTFICNTSLASALANLFPDFLGALVYCAVCVALTLPSLGLVDRIFQLVFSNYKEFALACSDLFKNKFVSPVKMRLQNACDGLHAAHISAEK